MLSLRKDFNFLCQPAATSAITLAFFWILVRQAKRRNFFMGSLPVDWPSCNPHNFSQLRPSDPSSPSRMTPATYHPTHNRTIPPPDQVITTEAKNILLRHIYQHAEEKLRSKRAAPEHLTPEHGGKQARASPSDSFS